MSKMIQECGGLEQFEREKSEGNVWEKNGLWYSREEEDVDESGRTNKMTLNMGEKKLTKQESYCLRAVPLQQMLSKHIIGSNMFQ